VSATVTASPTDGGSLSGASYWSTTTEKWAPMTASGHDFTATFTPERGGLARVAVRLIDKDGIAGPPAYLDFECGSSDVTEPLSGRTTRRSSTAVACASPVSTTAMAFTAQPGQGALTVGSSTGGDYLKGRILDARVWAGAVSGAQQLSELLGE
jgi:hypothetical protein